ncbi:MAG: hypothetical protein CVV49_17020 [Spirochaetae bacterium HGW-Spirochaetae-5]|nr:MAG: hypothetical protein CVV49_17020 [Spirochaetae bacterium HGW-Spirochaetae-5]
MKKFLPVLLLLSVILILSCSTHKFINKDVNPKGKIAVIIGDTKLKSENALYADNFSQALKAGSTLNVLSQKQIKSSLGSYPERIKGPYKIVGVDEQPKPDYSLRDMDSLAAIAKKLNVQYLYTFWIPQAIHAKQAGSEAVQYWYVAELIEFPSRRIIAQGDMNMIYIIKGNTAGPVPRSVEDMCKYFSEIVAKEIIENIGVSR